MGNLRNWAGNVAFSTEVLRRPASIPELQEIVSRSRQVRALGSGHSFNRIADTAGALISVADLPRDITIDTASATAEVPAGASYAQVSQALEARGWALPNLASLPHISVAGACCTGTHGSGDQLACLASHAVGGEFVWIETNNNGGNLHSVKCTLTTSWTRYSITVTDPTTIFMCGVYLGDVTNTPTPAQTIYVWGAQGEVGSSSTAYAATTDNRSVKVGSPGLPTTAFADFWNLNRRRRFRPSERPLLLETASTWEPTIRFHRNVPRLWMFPIRSMYLEAIARASRNIWITTAYFLPYQDFVRALTDAAGRGVDVRLLIPAKSNHVVADWISRGYFSQLLDAGVKLLRYRDAMVHAKTATIDVCPKVTPPDGPSRPDRPSGGSARCATGRRWSGR